MPFVPGIGVLALVPDKWGDTWMPRQHVLTRLGRYFNVVWVNPAREWRELWIYRPTRAQEADTNDAIMPGFFIYKPERWLPLLYRPHFLAEFTAKQRLHRAHAILRNKGCQKTIVYLWRPKFECALDMVEHDLSCYHIDDEYTFSDIEQPLDQREARLISRVDQVFIHSPGLLRKKGNLNHQTLFVPNGVDYRAYATPWDEPTDIRPIPHPRIGYTGILKKQLDWPLLLNLALRHPEWSFVFVGPRAPHPEVRSFIEKLSSMQNVHFLGAKSVHDLAGYPQHFDVCVMPYRLGDYTKYIFPLKLNEYLAGGRPTVGTRIPSLEEFSDVVLLAGSVDEWSAAIEDSLNSALNTTAARSARQSVARAHDWEVIVLKIARKMAERLGEEYAARLENGLQQRQNSVPSDTFAAYLENHRDPVI